MDEGNLTRTAHSRTDRLDMDLSFLDDLWHDRRPPNSFTAAEAADKWGIDRNVAHKRLQKMVNNGKLLRSEPSAGVKAYYWRTDEDTQS